MSRGLETNTDGSCPDFSLKRSSGARSVVAIIPSTSGHGSQVMPVSCGHGVIRFVDMSIRYVACDTYTPEHIRRNVTASISPRLCRSSSCRWMNDHVICIPISHRASTVSVADWPHLMTTLMSWLNFRRNCTPAFSKTRLQFPRLPEMQLCFHSLFFILLLFFFFFLGSRTWEQNTICWRGAKKKKGEERLIYNRKSAESPRWKKHKCRKCRLAESPLNEPTKHLIGGWHTLSNPHTV